MTKGLGNDMSIKTAPEKDKNAACEHIGLHAAFLSIFCPFAMKKRPLPEFIEGVRRWMQWIDRLTGKHTSVLNSPIGLIFAYFYYFRDKLGYTYLQVCRICKLLL